LLVEVQAEAEKVVVVVEAEYYPLLQVQYQDLVPIL
jgi:hypothetical protein